MLGHLQVIMLMILPGDNVNDSTSNVYYRDRDECVFMSLYEFAV